MHFKELEEAGALEAGAQAHERGPGLRARSQRRGDTSRSLPGAQHPTPARAPAPLEICLPGLFANRGRFTLSLFLSRERPALEGFVRSAFFFSGFPHFQGIQRTERASREPRQPASFALFPPFTVCSLTTAAPQPQDLSKRTWRPGPPSRPGPVAGLWERRGKCQLAPSPDLQSSEQFSNRVAFVPTAPTLPLLGSR